MLKHEVKQKDREIAELRSKGNVPVGAQVGQGELKGTVGVPNRGYAAAAARPKQATYAMKVTAKEVGDIGQDIMAEGGGGPRRRDSNSSTVSEGEPSSQGAGSDREQLESPEDVLNNRVRELSRIILHSIPAGADSIKVESRRACREAAEKVRDYAMEM
ncbi:hypothetical protein ILUMI_07767, partial [Ignelater luminosus]